MRQSPPAKTCYSPVQSALWLLIAACLCCAIPADAASERSPSGTGLSVETYPYSEPLRDFLNRGHWRGYSNLGKYVYAPETVSVLSYELYDRLGSHLFRGYPLMSWRETRSDSLGLQESNLAREIYFFQFFNDLVVADDSYRGWSFSAALGDNIRTNLTPLTLRTPQWQGVRIDGGAADQGFTMLLTRGSYDRFSAFDARLDRSPVLAYGGRYYRQPSDVLTVGLTFYNQHQVDVESKRGSFFSGTQPYQIRPPDEISVWIESDAPETGAVAGVADVDIEIVVQEEGGRRRLSSDPDAAPPAEYSPGLLPRVSGGTRVGALRQVRGPDQRVEYLFALPANAAIVDARFEADVVGDYCISVRQTHRYLNAAGELDERAWPSTASPTHSQRGNPLYPYDFKPSEAEPHFTVARASGSPGLERARTVRFTHGIPSGKTLLGTDFQIAARELMGSGEVVYNIEEQHFPLSSDSLDVRGKKGTTGAWAYLFDVRMPLQVRGRSLELGGELYRMDPDYSGGYDSRRGGTIFFTDQGGPKGREAFTQELPLMEDNDDDDEIPDDTFPDQGRFQQYIPGTYSGGRAGGVFPGLDEDGDLTPDNDRDRNGVPDWTEPFLYMGSDPADFVYGIDFNNNAQPDFRENDDYPDYPIRRDQKGIHGYVALPHALPGPTRLSAGWYSSREIAGWGEASALYARLGGTWYAPGGVRVEVNDDVKLVEDTIRDDAYEWAIGDTSSLANVYSPLAPPPADPLVMRKSLVNFGAAELAWEHRSGVRVGLDLLHYLNRQADIEGVQESDTFTEFAMVTRAEYGRRWGKVDLWTGIKYAAQEGHRGLAWEDASRRFRAAAIKVRYQIMPGMALRWGMSGLPGLRMRFTDDGDPMRSYEEAKSVLMLQGTSDSFMGMSLSISSGVQVHHRDYDEGDRIRDFDTVGIFVDVIAGN